MDGVFMETSTDQNNNNNNKKMVDGIHLKKGRAHHRNKLESKRMKYKDGVGVGVHVHEDQFDAPKKKISTCCSDGNSSPCSQSSPSLSHGSVSVCGRRRTMEDTVTIAPGLLSTECETFLDFFAVYDGHGGAGVAHVCKDRLHRVLAEKIEEVLEGQQENGIDWDKVLEASFLKMDGEVDDKGTQVQNMKSIGSTALVALIERNKVIVANCGDSRAVLSRGGVAVPLSCDHKPDRPDELERVEAAGGRVINWNGYRVLGVLATSRSIGDQYLKPYVISTPEISITERTPKDEFIILASDGLWDVMSNEFACQVVRKCLHGRIRRKTTPSLQGSSAAEAAAVLTELAMARGSRDNISVVVIELNKLQ